VIRICSDLAGQQLNSAFSTPSLSSAGKFYAIFMEDIKQTGAFTDGDLFGQRDQPDGIGFQQLSRKLL
jgi:hypothetical protein